MNDKVQDRFEIPKEMRSMAEASFDQARKAFEKFVDRAQQPPARSRSGARPFVPAPRTSAPRR